MRTAETGAVGFAPTLSIRPIEREIYRQMWEFDEYRAVAPGELVAQEFLQQAKPKPGAQIIDFGCGTGRGSLMLAMMGQLDVTMVDFAENCLDADIRPMLETQSHVMRFVEADLCKSIPVSAAYGYCTDVMEHIPPSLVDKVLDNILGAAQHVFFMISTVDDVCGKLIGHKLHLSVHPFAWWLRKFQERGCLVHWSKEADDHCMIYVSGWSDGKDLVAAGELNTTELAIIENVKANVAAGWQQIIPHPTNDVEVMILGGGPSLVQFEDEIRQKRADGVKLIALNGTYNWCLDRGIAPSALVMVDAREFNARFSHPVVDDCKYLIASQCHPAVLEGLPKDRTYLWHTTTELIADVLHKAYEVYYAVPGGSTALLRAIPLLRMLGFKRFHLYGCDSCLEDGKHHAYDQPENDSPLVIPVSVANGRVFYCHPWMAAQGQELIETIKFLGDEIELEIHGDGLLKHILDVGAQMDDLQLQAAVT